LDRALAAASPAQAQSVQPAPQAQNMPQPSGYREGRHGYNDRDHYKRKKSWLHEIFD
jgi:Zn-finger nucleic acid-binding protein